MTNEFEIETLLFQQINKPKDYLMLKAINIFGDYYRVNVYTQVEEEGLLKKRIGNNSYFCKFEDNSLKIIKANKVLS